jgi:orotidine-5'-phosphate decarboxylase
MTLGLTHPALVEPHMPRAVRGNRTAIPDNERLIVPLDVSSPDEARELVETLGDEVVFYKIGMQLQFTGGFALASELLATGKKVFLDSKLFDIDATIENAVRSVASMGVHFLTVHGNGKTIRAAIKGRGDSQLKVLSVTVLTSLDAHDIQDLGYNCSVEQLAMFRAEKALEAGADGVITSGQEAAAIRKLAGDRLTIVTPGVRPDGTPVQDQKRIVTPREAILAGADYIVVGRPITGAADPREAARAIIAEIAVASREALAR